MDPKISIKVILKDDKYILEKNGKPCPKVYLKLIQFMKIPKAYETVWLSKNKESNIQAIALDSKNRKQYYYSKEWIANRSSEKFQRMYKFMKKMPLLDKSIQTDIKQKMDTKTKTMAIMLKIVQLTHIRIGNKKYMDQNSSSGLTTLKKSNVLKCNNSSTVLKFTGKHKVEHTIEIKDPTIAKFIKHNLTTPKDWIMKFKSSDGEYYRVSAQDLNDYIHSIIGDGFSCKDFRTHGANVTFYETLKSLVFPETPSKIKSNIIKAMDVTAVKLGNNRSTSKSSYVMDHIILTYTKNPKCIKKNLIDLVREI